ncbi:hypothetical protein L7F22_022723, partial [Adiantum nelumboides]|nr:hypothetical protein [Adiantum nelumboides]
AIALLAVSPNCGRVLVGAEGQSDGSALVSLCGVARDSGPVLVATVSTPSTRARGRPPSRYVRGHSLSLSLETRVSTRGAAEGVARDLLAGALWNEESWAAQQRIPWCPRGVLLNVQRTRLHSVHSPPSAAGSTLLQQQVQWGGSPSSGVGTVGPTVGPAPSRKEKASPASRPSEGPIVIAVYRTRPQRHLDVGHCNTRPPLIRCGGKMMEPRPAARDHSVSCL